MAAKRNEIDMINGPILGKVLLFSFPLMLSGLLQLLFNAADVIVVGRWAGDNSLAAVSSTTAIVNLLTNLFIGLSIGGNVLTAKYLGAKKSKDVSETIHTAITLSLLCGVGLAILGFFVARSILELMDSPENVIDLSTTYLKILFLSMPAMLCYNFGSAVLRAKGDTKRPLIYLSVAGLLNVGLNLFFVIVMKLDVAGVALATSISQCLSAVLIVRCLMKERGSYRLMLGALRIHKDKFLGILKIGLPAGINGVLFSISNVTIQASVNSFGDIVMAGNGAAQSIEGFVYVSINSFYQASISFTGQNVGAERYERIKKILATTLGCAVVTGIVLGNIAYFFGEGLLGIYSKSPEVIAAGIVRLSIISTTYALCGVMDTLVGVLRGMGYSVLPTIMSLIGACILRIVWIATVFRIPQYHTIQCIYISYPITWVITAAAQFVCYMWIMKHRINTAIEEKHA